MFHSDATVTRPAKPKNASMAVSMAFSRGCRQEATIWSVLDKALDEKSAGKIAVNFAFRNGCSATKDIEEHGTPKQ